jgi:hypothetical protein
VDFIERLLGFSPDHGDGSVEAMLLLVPLSAEGSAVVMSEFI